jgi:nucleotide-binding universal stress UspA family protein
MTPDLILVPIDCAGGAVQLCETAAGLVGRLQARVLLLAVTHLPPGLAPGTVLNSGLGRTATAQHIMDADAAAQLDALRGLFPEGINVTTLVRHGDPGEQILAVASEREVSMIIMGTHGRKGVARWILGSVCERVVRHATVPVLTVRSGDPSAHRGPSDTARRLEAEATG